MSTAGAGRFFQGPSYPVFSIQQSIHRFSFLLDLRLHLDLDLYRATLPAERVRLSFYQQQQPCTSLQTCCPQALAALWTPAVKAIFRSHIENQIHIAIISGHHTNTFLSGYNLSTPTYPPIIVLSYAALHALDSITLFQVFLLHWLKTHTS